MKNYMRSSLFCKSAARERYRFPPPFVKKVSGRLFDVETRTNADEVVESYPAYQFLVERARKIKEKYTRMSLSALNSGVNKSSKFYAQLLEMVERDPETGIIIDVGFEEIIEQIKQERFSFRKERAAFDEWNVLSAGLNNMNEFQLMDALKFSVALQLSREPRDVLKGRLLSGLFRSPAELKKIQKGKKLSLRTALAIVSGKVDSILRSKAKGSSYEAAEFVRLVRMNAQLDPRSYISVDFLRRIYPETAHDLSSDADSLPFVARLSERQGQAERKIMQNFYNRDISDSNSTKPVESTDQKADEIQRLVDFFAAEHIEAYLGEGKAFGSPVEVIDQVMDEAQLEKVELAMHLSKILGNNAIDGSIESDISRLEALLGFTDPRSLSHEVLSGQLDLLIARLPSKLKSKFLAASTETELAFKARYANNTDSFLSLQWNNVDIEVPASFMPVAEYLQFRDLETNMGTYHRYVGMGQTAQALADDLELHSNTVRPDYIYRPREDVRHRAGTEYINFNFSGTVQPRLKRKMKQLAALLREDKRSYHGFLQPLHTAHLKSLLRKSRSINQDGKLQSYFDFFFLASRDDTIEAFVQRLFDDEDEYLKGRKDPPTFKTLHKYPEQLSGTGLSLFRQHRGQDTFIVETGIDMRNRTLRPTYDFKYMEESKLGRTQFQTGQLLEIEDRIQKDVSVPGVSANLLRSVESQSVGSVEIDESNRMKLASAEFLADMKKDDMYKHYFEGSFMLSQVSSPVNYDIIRGDSLETRELDGKIISQRDLFDRDVLREFPPRPPAKPSSNKSTWQRYTSILEKGTNFDREAVRDTYVGRGSRKEARAYAFLTKEGTGRLSVNNREFIEYFNVANNRFLVIKSIVALNMCGKVDVQFFVHGGGTSSQAEACLLAVSKALIRAFPEHKQFLTERYFTFTDRRTVQQKTTGLYKARKRYTYVRR